MQLFYRCTLLLYIERSLAWFKDLGFQEPNPVGVTVFWIKALAVNGVKHLAGLGCVVA